MDESVGYTVTINIIITFIVIVFVFLANALIYYKSNKVGNVITDSIEKYSGFNTYAKEEIERKLVSIGYNKMSIKCDETVKINGNDVCNVVDANSTKKSGYCVYLCDSKDDYYYYKVKTNMTINIPIINNFVHGTVFSGTGNLYNFTEADIQPTYYRGQLENFQTPPQYRVPSENSLLLGDVNGDGKVDGTDCSAIQEFSASANSLTEDGKFVADLNFDGEIDITDVTYCSMIDEYYYIILGDVNEDGEITFDDANLIQYLLVGKISLKEEQIKAADINKDGKVDIADVGAIQKIIQ